MLFPGRILLIVLTTTLCACSFPGSVKLPGLYRVNIQQGNVLEQSMLDRLRSGMDKNQVEFILGTPAFVDPFHTDQWEYFFSMAVGGDNRAQRHLRVHFVDEKLAYIDGDVVVTNRDLTDPIRQSRTVEVPANRRRPQGLFSRMFNSLPFVGDDPPILTNTSAQDEESASEEEVAPEEETELSE